VNLLVRRAVRRFAAKGQRLELVVIDYLGRLRPDQGTRRGLYEDVTEISAQLKQIAIDNRVGLMTLAQLSRDVEKRGQPKGKELADHKQKIPMLSDLRDSGSIEQDADAVMFLFREEYYLQRDKPAKDDPHRQAWDDRLIDSKGRIDFILAKRRNGQIGRAHGEFHGEFQAVR
jgi:replicative DNA helicase